MPTRERPKGKDAKEIRKDAEGQFARSPHGRRNSGVSSAEPRVITGDEDATFDTDPEGKRRKSDTGRPEED